MPPNDLIYLQPVYRTFMEAKCASTKDHIDWDEWQYVNRVVRRNTWILKQWKNRNIFICRIRQSKRMGLIVEFLLVRYSMSSVMPYVANKWPTHVPFTTHSDSIFSTEPWNCHSTSSRYTCSHSNKNTILICLTIMPSRYIEAHGNIP